MENDIPEINELIKQFSKLPGLGPKSAKRIILKLINNKKEIYRMSSKAINIVNTWFNFERYNKDVKDIIKETEESN